jgi:hypothetical protein
MTNLLSQDELDELAMESIDAITEPYSYLESDEERESLIARYKRVVALFARLGANVSDNSDQWR